MFGDPAQQVTRLAYNNVSSIMFLKPEVCAIRRASFYELFLMWGSIWLARTVLGQYSIPYIRAEPFTFRQVACVGMNEQEARRLNIPHRVASMGFEVTNRGIINRPQHAREYYEHPASEDMTGPKSQERRRAMGSARLERSGTPQ